MKTIAMIPARLGIEPHISSQNMIPVL